MATKMVDIDNKLWNEFYKKCVMKDVTMKAQLTALIKKWMEEK